jgi:hypothetical protein
MTLKQKIVGALLAIAALFGGGATLGGLTSDTFSYKNLTSANASSTKGVIVRGGSGVLGSVIIASSSPAVTLGFRIYDGVATSTTDTTATSSGTLIATVKTTTSEQTLDFNVAVTKGIVVDVPPGFAGSFTVTSK